MSDTAHISRNGDGSLRHRVDEYLATVDAYNNVQHSKKYMNDPEWSETLGHMEDIEQAENILEQSLSHFTDLIDQQDLKLALSQGFMTEEQARNFQKPKCRWNLRARQENQVSHRLAILDTRNEILSVELLIS